MTLALPVLVDCVPYRARLTAVACADRWRIANAKRLSNELPGSGYGGIRQSQCRECEVGEQRAKEETTQRRSQQKQVTKDLVVPGAPPAAAEPTKEPEMFSEKKCPDCRKMFVPRAPRQLRCDPCRGIVIEKAVGGGNKKKEPRNPVALLAPAPKPLLTVYLEKQAAIEELKQRHAAELATAHNELSDFESNHPEVLEQARQVLERVVSAQPRQVA